MPDALFGQCPLWPMPSLANALFGRCPLWPMPSLADALFGRCPLWPMPNAHLKFTLLAQQLSLTKNKCKEM